VKNFIEMGDTLTVPAPSGGVLSGGVVIIGSLIGVAGSTAAATVNVAVKTKGVFEFPKVSAQAWATVGLPIYWDAAVPNATTTSSGNTLIGYNTEVAANPSSVGRVRIG
jgi:predicted RecA/RadA family phage recombinase